LLHQLEYLSLVVIHTDPEESSGERHHRIEQHVHDGLPAHLHAIGIAPSCNNARLASADKAPIRKSRTHSNRPVAA
jgi:hypothetical protein